MNGKSILKKIVGFFVSIFQYVLITVIALGAAYSTEVGQWFILAFLLYLFFIKRDSRLAFGVALFLIIIIPFFNFLNQNGIAQNAAVYAFEVLVIGTLQSIIEIKWPSKRLKKGL